MAGALVAGDAVEAFAAGWSSCYRGTLIPPTRAETGGGGGGGGPDRTAAVATTGLRVSAWPHGHDPALGCAIADAKRQVSFARSPATLRPRPASLQLPGLTVRGPEDGHNTTSLRTARR